MSNTLSDKAFNCVGIMSGTSLDGVDMVLVQFIYKDGWRFTIDSAKTYEYDVDILNRLKSAQNLSGLELAQLNVDYGKYLGQLTVQFCTNLNVKPEFVASHGYTVFHEPKKGLTLQIGSGAHIASISGLTTICDFRTLDVALGGQGAPLVPIGDELLFGQFFACLNLGGFSNISFKQNGQRIAFDICPVNYVLNHYAEKLGKVYDKGGELGKRGNVNKTLLNKLNALSYYKQSPPKSLGREFVEKEVYSLIDETESIENILRTFYEHITDQLAHVINEQVDGEVLVTGGGAHNNFIIELLQSKSNCPIIILDSKTIDFKEALIFAFLGLLRQLNINNCLSSVTGANADNCGGTIYSPL